MIEELEKLESYYKQHEINYLLYEKINEIAKELNEIKSLIEPSSH